MKSFLDKHSSVIALDFHINRVSIPFRIISFAFLIVHISLYSLNSITSDEKIQITILILRRGALSRFTCNYFIWLVKLLKIVGRMFLIKWTTYIWGSRDLASCMFASMSFPCVIIRFVFFLYCQLSSHNTVTILQYNTFMSKDSIQWQKIKLDKKEERQNHGGSKYLTPSMFLLNN